MLKSLLSHDSKPTTSRTSFFSDPSVKALLSKPTPSFPRPAPQSKSTFETKTAAINVSPSPPDEYDIDEIKSDTLWLSQFMQIDELEALRLTLLEWQYRSEGRLLSGFSDAEVASLRDCLGSEYVESIGLVPGGAYSRSDARFDSAEGRQVRLLRLYFSEQVRLLLTASEILQHSLLSSSQSERSDIWAPILKALNAKPPGELLEIIQTAVDSIKDRLTSLNGDRSWPVNDEYHAKLNEDFATSNLQSIAVILDMLLLRIRKSEEHVYSESLTTWLQFMESVNYFSPLQSNSPVQAKAIERIQCTISCITVALVDPSSTFGSLVQDTALESISTPPPGKRDWFIDKDQINDVHHFLFAAAESCNAQASLAVMAWALILLEIRALATTAKESREARHVQRGIERSPYDPSGRRLSSSSTGSIQLTIYEDVLSEVMATSNVEDPVDYMLNCATQGANVFDQYTEMCSLIKEGTSILSSVQLQLLQEWIRAIRPSLGYSPELFDAQLNILGPPPPSQSAFPMGFNPVTNFLGDEVLRQDFLDVAASRFPYESLPFLRLCRTLTRFATTDTDGTNYVTYRLQQLNSFTQAAVGGFASYNTYREDENANLVQLDCAVGMLDFEQNKMLTYGHSEQYLNLIPSHTIGEVIKETTPAVVRWQYAYSGFSLLGKWLEMYRKGTLSEALSPFEPPEEVAAETLGLLAALLDMTYTHAKTARGEQAAQQLCDTILADLDSALDPGFNIITCISDLLEHQLQSSARSGYEVLIACIDFFTAYCKIQPQLAWSVLLRSSAFGAKGTRRTLPALIAGIEVPSRDFRLLESCSRMYQATIDLLLVVSFDGEDQVQSVKELRKGRRTASQRFNGAALLAYSETMYVAFDSMTAWIFSSKAQKDRITSNFSSAFSDLLYYAFGTGESVSTVTSLSACLLPAATFVAQMLQQADATSTGTGPLMPTLVNAVLEHNSTDAFSTHETANFKHVLSLSQVLVRYGHLSAKGSTEVPSSFLNLMPVLVRLPLAYAGLWYGCNTLLSYLLHVPSPSVLGYLGSTSCVGFVDCLKHASQALISADMDRQMWNVLSRLVTADQQWFAILLITGSPPGRQRENGNMTKLQTRGKSMLETSLDLLTDVGQLDPGVSAELLNFVGEAQQNWLSVTDSIASRTDLFPHLVKWVSSRDPHNADGPDRAVHNRVAAGVTELAVIHLHRLMALKNEKVFTSFIPLLQWLATNAVDVAAYNASLHANLKKNFAMKYRGLDVTSTKRSGLLDIRYGDNYFYDTDFADKFLSNDPFWKNDRGQQTFLAEFRRANINFSVVDSELRLLRSLERLCVEHGMFFSRNRDIARVMAQIARHCLSANLEVAPAETLFDSLFQIRADLAVVLVRPLAAAGYHGSDYSGLLTASWDAARFRNGSYEMAIANDDLAYWRSIMSVLLLSIQFRVERKVKQASVGDSKSLEKIDPYNAAFCEITAKIVGEGLRSVTMALQEQKQAQNESPITESARVGAKDVALLLHMLQSILRLPSLSQFAVQLGEALISTGTGRSALLLYSWSHMLLGAGEPVYADLASRFLASISSLPRVAEELAVEGVLNRLLTSQITQSLQTVPNGLSHLEKQPKGQLLYSIWAQGMLPLCLNLLHAVGGGVAGEVSSFLNAFEEQLNRTSLALSANPAYASEGSGMLTTTMVGELSTLTLISFILASFREAGASAGVDSTAIMMLAGFDEHKKAIAEDVRDVLAQDYAGRKKRIIPESDRERAMQRNAKNQDGKLVGDALDSKIVRDLRGALSCLVNEDEAVVMEDAERDR